MEGHDDTEQLGNTVKDVPGDPQIISHTDTLARTDLVLPLSRHNLSVGSSDLDSSVDASLVVGNFDITTESVLSTGSAVVGSLGLGSSLLGETKGTTIGGEHGVFLLDTEPRLEVLDLVHNFVALLAGVGSDGGAINLVLIAPDEDVGVSTEGVLVDPARTDPDLRVVSRGLIGGGTVIVPVGDLRSVSDLVLPDGTDLGADVKAVSTLPAVGNHHGSLLGEGKELLDSVVIRVGVIVDVFAHEGVSLSHRCRVLCFVKKKRSGVLVFLL